MESAANPKPSAVFFSCECILCGVYVCVFVCARTHTQMQTNSCHVLPPVRSEHGIRYVKLPSASSASSVLRFLENMCQHLESDSLFSSQPFSPYTNNSRFYNRAKSGGGNVCMY